ncbi:hypothetical protein A6F65_02406 [Paraurantiacibacter namhicola]|uniref:Uncharacterized protein n=1 Tax=Paraurantiacibacter namhicola TaxID=645517 RepID=A0A1C7DB92_9SPHN|nr:hypothetical protein A6F65_02406 [Paraurantiacibacter namhicola]
MKYPLLAPVAGLVVVLVGVGGHLATGTIYSALHAREMLEALTGPALYLGSAIAASAATTMALMLTLLGLVRRVDADFDLPMYRRIYLVSMASAVLMAGSVIMLLVMTLPIGEFEKVPTDWFPALFKVLYWTVVGLSALLVTMVTLLFSTIRALIAQLTPHDDVDFLAPKS